jgi:hypothetical protein
MITSTTVRQTFACDGSAKAFTIVMPFIETDDIVVYLHDVAADTLTLLTEGANYSIASPTMTFEGGGTLTTVLTYSASYQLVAVRRVDLLQLVNYIEGDSFPAETHERALDKLTMICQQLDEEKIEGPAAVIDEKIAIFDGTTGGKLKQSEYGESDLEDFRTHADGDGSDHANVALNDAHRLTTGTPHVTAGEKGYWNSKVDAAMVSGLDANPSIATDDMVFTAKDSLPSPLPYKTTLGALRTWLKTYFDTLYDAAGGLAAHLLAFTHSDIALNTSHRGTVTGNPHAVTKTEVGLGNVANTAQVTDVTATTPLSSTGGTTPAISIQQATSGQNGFMTWGHVSKLDGIETSADVTDAANVASSIHGVDAKAPPADADEVAIIDTEALNVLKKTTWTAIKAFLKTYFDTLYAAAGGSVTSVTASSPLSSSGGLTPNITIGNFPKGTVLAQIASASPIPPASTDVTDVVAYGVGSASAGSSIVDGDRFPYEETGVGDTLKTAAWSLIKSTLKTYFDGLYAAAASYVTSVTGTAPIVSSGGATPAISISAATTDAAGSMSSADKTKLDGIAAGAQPGTVTDVSASAPIASSGGTTPAITINAATALGAGSMSAAHWSKLEGIEAEANKYVHPNHSGDVTSVADGATAIGANKVTLGMMAKLPQTSIIGLGPTGGGVDDTPVALTPTGARAILNVADGANNYTLPTAAAATLGGVKVGDRLTITDGVLSADVQASPDWSLIAAAQYTAEPASTSVITMASPQTYFKAGQPVKYTYGGQTYYGLVIGVVDNTSITLRGAPLVTGGGSNLTALYAGKMERVVAVSMFVSGAYGDGAQATLLVTDMKSPLWWSTGKAYLASVEATHLTVDTGTEPIINIKIAGDSALSTGITLGAAQALCYGGVALDTAKYDINPGEALDVACTTAGGTGDAKDLTVQCVFVLE